MSNIIASIKIAKKLAITLFIIVALFVVASTQSEAKAAGETLRHAFKPHMDTATGQTVARVNNWSPMPFSGWICAQERTSAGRRVHLGCLKAYMDPVRGENWSFQFGVQPKFKGTLTFTYQASDGTWHSVLPAL